MAKGGQHCHVPEFGHDDGEGSSTARRRSHHHHHHHRISRETHHRGKDSSFTAEFGSLESTPDHSLIHRRVKLSNHKKSVSEGGRGSLISSFSSSVHNGRRRNVSSFHDYMKPESTLTPRFGDWDVTDPKSGEGYTAIFAQIKQEKQIASAHVNPSSNTCSIIQNRRGRLSPMLSKYFCCLFSSERK